KQNTQSDQAAQAAQADQADPRHDYKASLTEVLDHIALDRHFFNLHEPRQPYTNVMRSLVNEKRNLWIHACDDVTDYHGIKIPNYYTYDPQSKQAYVLRFIPSGADWDISATGVRNPPPKKC